MTITDSVKQFIADNPTVLIKQMDYDNQSVWIKRRPKSKKHIWHQLLHYITYVIPLPIIYPTVVSDVTNSLLDEAARFQRFAAHNIPVPAVLAVEQDYLVTSDVGSMVQEYLNDAPDGREKYYLLEQAMSALIQLHQANLCHGRPSLRDMTYLDGQVFFIDLEEEPLNVMSLEQAQARDLWLFLNNAARHCKANPSHLDDLAQFYLINANPDILVSLRQMVFFLRPLRWFIEYCLFSIKSRDLRCAVLANKALERIFRKAALKKVEA